MNSSDIKQQTLDSLLGILREVPVVRDINYTLDTNSNADLEIEVDTYRDVYRLIVGIRNNGQPRYARDAIAQLMLKTGRSSGSAYPVFAAPFISESAADICRQAETGHIDFCGNCRLAFNGIYIERQGQPNRFLTRRSLRSLYRSRSSRILRALLFDPNLKWKLKDLSQASGASIGQVFNVKSALVDREWAEFNKDGLLLTQPKQVLLDWGENYELEKKNLFNFHSTDSTVETAARLADLFPKSGLRYALTSFSASARMAPDMERTHLYAYVDTDIDRAAELLELRSGEADPNVTLMLPYDEGVFFGMREIEGVHTVSPIQTYLDLAALKDDGDPAAESFLARVVAKEWQ